MREKAVITQGDTKSTGSQHKKEEGDLKPIESEKPEIERDRGEGKGQGSDEEGTGHPVNTIKG